MKKPNRIALKGKHPAHSPQPTIGSDAPPQKRIWPAVEWKVTSVRKTAAVNTLCDSPQLAAKYWREHIATGPQFSPEVEWLVVVVLNTKRCVRSHYIVSMGTMNGSLAHPREVFRAAIIGGAHSIVALHNHPSGNPAPSQDDRALTERLCTAAAFLQVHLYDHVIVGADDYFSFREVGLIGEGNSCSSQVAGGSAGAAPKGAGKPGFDWGKMMELENAVNVSRAMLFLMETAYGGACEENGAFAHPDNGCQTGISTLCHETREKLESCFTTVAKGVQKARAA